MSDSTNPNLDTRPTLQTERLVLRPFEAVDAPALHGLINDPEIAANTRNIEYPYPDGAGLEWIAKHPELWVQGKSAIFAVCLKSN